MAWYSTFFSIFIAIALQAVQVYSESTCVGENQTVPCPEIPQAVQSPVYLKPPEVVAVVVSIVIFAIIVVAIVIFICSRCGRAKKEAVSLPPEYMSTSAAPSIHYSETSEYARRTNPYHANKEWQDRRAWSMTT